MKTTLPKFWWTKVTEENKEVLSAWRDVDLAPGNITGWGNFWGRGGSKEHDLNAIDIAPEYGEEITFEEFKKFVLKGEKIMTNNTLTRKQLVEAYNTFPCEKWKATIRELLVKHALALDEDSIAIPTEDLQLLVKEGTDAQKNYVKSLGVAFPGDDNAFIKDCSSLQTEVKNMSEKLFGDNLVFQILGGHTPIDRPELKGRAFYLHSAYKLETIPAKAGTAIIISKK